jgi:hypothetical protein
LSDLRHRNIANESSTHFRRHPLTDVRRLIVVGRIWPSLQGDLNECIGCSSGASSRVGC